MSDRPDDPKQPRSIPEQIAARVAKTNAASLASVRGHVMRDQPGASLAIRQAERNARYIERQAKFMEHTLPKLPGATAFERMERTHKQIADALDDKCTRMLRGMDRLDRQMARAMAHHKPVRSLLGLDAQPSIGRALGLDAGKWGVLGQAGQPSIGRALGLDAGKWGVLGHAGQPSMSRALALDAAGLPSTRALGLAGPPISERIQRMVREIAGVSTLNRAALAAAGTTSVLDVLGGRVRFQGAALGAAGPLRGNSALFEMAAGLAGRSISDRVSFAALAGQPVFDPEAFRRIIRTVDAALEAFQPAAPASVDGAPPVRVFNDSAAGTVVVDGTAAEMVEMPTDHPAFLTLVMAVAHAIGERAPSRETFRDAIMVAMFLLGVLTFMKPPATVVIRDDGAGRVTPPGPAPPPAPKPLNTRPAHPPVQGGPHRHHRQSQRKGLPRRRP